MILGLGIIRRIGVGEGFMGGIIMGGGMDMVGVGVEVEVGAEVMEGVEVVGEG